MDDPQSYINCKLRRRYATFQYFIK